MVWSKIRGVHVTQDTLTNGSHIYHPKLRCSNAVHFVVVANYQPNTVHDS